MTDHISSIDLEVSCIEKYPAKQHTQAVSRKLGDSDGLIYLLGQYDFTIEDSDQPKTWRQRRYFYYCSGVDVPDCCLTYDIRTDHLILYIPSIKPERVIWTGRGPTLEEAEDLYDVDEVRLNHQLFADLECWKRNHSQSIFYVLHDDHRPPDKYFQPPQVDYEKLLPAIDACRVIKDAHEIKLIRKANDITARAHRSVLRNITSFKNESQIQGIFVDACLSKDAKQAYQVIAGSGENAGTLHYVKNNEPLKGRQLVCLDAGSEWECYASDVTRTFPISGKWPSQEARDIYEIVQHMQEFCIEKLRPGVPFFYLHFLAHIIAIEGLLKLGILQGATVEELASLGTCRAFFPHGLGHHLGLEVHDVPGIPVLWSDKDQSSLLDVNRSMPPCTADSPKLEAGMVVTVEPGIYFSRYELERSYLHSPIHSRYINKEVLERYYPVGGVRIEDDILITAHGYENLTTAPKGNEALEIIQNGSKFNYSMRFDDDI